MGNDIGYSEEKIIREEQLFRVDEKQSLSIVHKLIGALVFLDRKKKFNCGSGMLISNNLVLTSAHNIYSKQASCEFHQFKFYLGCHGTATSYYEIQGWRYLPQYKTSSNKNKLQFDYALLKLKREVEFEKFLPLSLPCEICLKSKSKQVFLQIFGYPGRLGNYRPLDKFGESRVLYQYGLSKKDRIQVIQPQNFKIGYAISTLPGQSGCPVITNEQVIAVHSGAGKINEDYNMGRLITLDFLANLQLWRKQLKGKQFEINSQNFCSHLENVVEMHKILNSDEVWLCNKQITSNDFTRNTFLKRLTLDSALLNTINLSLNVNLTELSLNGNQLTTIDLKNNKLLQKLWLGDNRISYINLRQNPLLAQAWLWENQLGQVDLSRNRNLLKLSLKQNKLSSIDLSFNSQLAEVWLDNNQLLGINLQNNPHLITLSLYQNKLTEVIIRFSSQIQISRYLSSSYFSLSHQKSSACVLRLVYKKEQQADCIHLKEKWGQMFKNENFFNKYKCNYQIQLIKRQ